jgi:general secretion pathway protein E
MVKPWQINGGYKPFKAVGCVECRMTGYMGRMGLYELLTVSEEFKELVGKNASMEALRRQGVPTACAPAPGRCLRVAEGLTVMEEVMAATPPLR